MKLLLSFWILSCFLLPSIAYAASEAAKPKSDLMVMKSESKVGSVLLDVSLLRSPGEGVGFSAMDTLQKRGFSVTTVPTPVNLRVLVDTSALCHLLKIDQQATDLLALVKRSFAKGSLISIVAFNSNGFEVFENQRSLEDWKGTTFSCKGTALAASYEKALTTTFQKTGSSLPNVVWVLTSGNVELSRDGANLLKQHGANLHILLHNPILEREIRPLVDQTAAIVGKDRVHFSALPSTAAALLPEQRFQLSLAVPVTNASSQAMVLVSAMRGGQTLASENVAVELAVDPWRKLLARIALFGGIAALIGLLGLAIFKTIHYYRARDCSRCGRRMRFSESLCLFCHGEEHAYLVGKFAWRDRRKLEQHDMVRISAAETELGTHRGSVLPLIRPAGKRRECLAKIFREGETAYRMEASDTSSVVKVNGRAVRGHRYLASGDLIQIGGREVTFLAKRSVQNE